MCIVTCVHVCLFVYLQLKTSYVMRSGNFSITEKTGSPLSKVVPKNLIIAGVACLLLYNVVLQVLNCMKDF